MKKKCGTLFHLLRKTVLSAAVLCLLFSMTAVAKTPDKTVVALGADLTVEQRASVLSQLGLTEEGLADCIVITITNDMEHTYLDAYLDSSLIGTKSLSCVKLEPSGSGSGVLVETHNINYCTTGMYRNALLTAGLEDTRVTVAAPTPISGTAALIGAIKGYEEMTGDSISDSTLDTAMDELITTGELAGSSENSDEIEALIAYIKGKLANGELESEEDIREAIEEGEEKFQITLTEEEIQKIIDVMDKISKLGLDLDSLIEQAGDLYDQFGTDIVNNPDKAITAVIKQQVSNFFSNLGNKIKNFFAGLFS